MDKEKIFVVMDMFYLDDGDPKEVLVAVCKDIDSAMTAVERRMLEGLDDAENELNICEVEKGIYKVTYRDDGSGEIYILEREIG